MNKPELTSQNVLLKSQLGKLLKMLDLKALLQFQKLKMEKTISDLTQRMREFQAQSFLAFEPFNSAALIYVLLTLIAASGVKALDNIINKSRER